MADTVLIDMLCFGGCKKNTPRRSTCLHCCSVLTMSAPSMGPHVGSMEYPLPGSEHLPVLECGISKTSLMYPQIPIVISMEPMLHSGIPKIGPLSTAHELVETQLEAACSYAYQVALLLLSPEWQPSRQNCPLTLKHPSMSQEVLCCSVRAVHRALPKWSKWPQNSETSHRIPKAAPGKKRSGLPPHTPPGASSCTDCFLLIMDSSRHYPHLRKILTSSETYGSFRFHSGNLKIILSLK